MSQNHRTRQPAAPWEGALGRLLFAVLAAGLVAWSAPLQAAESRMFEVRGVSVDATAENASAAREKALAEGERKAFRRLLERLTVARDQSRLPELPREEIQAYILDFTVAEEKTSSVRYLGTLNFRFKRQDVRQLLIAYNIPFAETPSKTVLVVPVMRRDGQAVLWDDGNPWYRAWASQPMGGGLLPIVLPLGDLQDISTLPVEAAIAGDREKLLATAQRLGAGDALVAVATVEEGSGQPAVRVEAQRYGGVEDEGARFALQAEDGEKLEELLVRAARETRGHIADNWKRRNLVDYGHGGVLAVTVPVATLRDWLGVRRVLGQISVVRRAEPILISTQEVRVNLHYVGDADQLITALEQADMSLAQEGREWILVPLGALPGRG